jgi:hypothetical protein
MHTKRFPINVGVAVSAMVLACQSPPVESPKTTVTQATPLRVPQNERNKVDILFMVDNSYSMDPMQEELRLRFKDFFQVFFDLARVGNFADMNVGVVTSDYGAGAGDGGNCELSPGGQGGMLQVAPSPHAANPPPGCQPPTGNTPFIHYDFKTSSGNLPGGTDLVSEFTCMASVGSSGCGFEHPLESVYAALHNTTYNAGFLRQDALLAIVFVTNEDDGSAAPGVHFYSRNPMWGQTASTYPQTRYGIFCDGNHVADGFDNMMGTTMTYGHCNDAPNPMNDQELAYHIGRYIDYFTRPAALGGVKLLASDVVLVGIDGPESPVAVKPYYANDGSPVDGYQEQHDCPSPLLSSMCIEAIKHSCQNNSTTTNRAFFADPAVRLNAVINKAQFHKITSICGDDPSQPPSYQAAMQQIGQLISSHLSPGCTPAPLVNYPNDPKCVVEDVTANPDGSQTIKEIPRCDVAGGSFPCWKIELKDQCKQIFPALCSGGDTSSCGAGITIDRNGQMAPANTNARVECLTVAQ